MNQDLKINSDEEKQIFCSFLLNQSEFALSVTHVQEVITPPTSYSIMPLSPIYLKGLINLRGSIIPVIDLKKVLNLSDSNQTPEQKIAIINLDGNLIGLLFDKTGEVFRGLHEEQNNFNGDDDSELVVKGVFKKDSGKRIIQILNIHSIYCLKNIPKRDVSQNQNHSALARRGLRKKAISFYVGPAKCSLEINQIQEILMIKNVNESALSVGNCIGTFDLRGTTVPVIDFASLLKYREVNTSTNATTGDKRVIVMKIANEFFGLLVDKVDSIVTFYQDELKAFPVLSTERSSMISGCITTADNEDILLLDDQKILTDTEINQITHGHSDLYTVAGTEQKNKNKSNVRKTYISFFIEQEYAINISDVREIIDLPVSLITPPEMPNHYCGLANLRGEMVMIVDSRKIYKKNTLENQSNAKVLVFKTDKAHFGLLVDSVQSIITLSENDKIKLPELMYKHAAGNSQADIIEAVQYKSSTAGEKMTLIIDANRIVERVLAAA